MIRSSNIFFTLLFALVCAISGNPQQRGQKPDSEQTIKIETTLISVPVIVSDRENRYVRDLKVEAFRLFDNQVEQKIAFFDAGEEPLNVVLMLDTSFSTSGVTGSLNVRRNCFGAVATTERWAGSAATSEACAQVLAVDRHSKAAASAAKITPVEVLLKRLLRATGPPQWRIARCATC